MGTKVPHNLLLPSEFSSLAASPVPPFRGSVPTDSVTTICDCAAFHFRCCIGWPSFLRRALLSVPLDIFESVSVCARKLIIAFNLLLPLKQLRKGLRCGLACAGTSTLSPSNKCIRYKNYRFYHATMTTKSDHRAITTLPFLRLKPSISHVIKIFTINFCRGR